MSPAVPFTKMAGTGNDFLIVDAVHHTLSAFKAAWPRVARAMCDRRGGVGADGLLVLERSRVADVRMRIFNPDGSEPEMCGNGARCVAAFVHGWRGRRRPQVSIETAGGLVSAQVSRARVRMRMPDPRNIRLGLRLSVDPRIRALAFLDTGVPHVVASVDDVDGLDVDALGRKLRHHQAFGPRGANVNFIETHPRAPHRLRIRTYERGVEGETLACGTGVTAAAVVHALGDGTGLRRRRVDVEPRSGEPLTVSLTIAGPRGARTVTDVVLEGGVRWICEGGFRWR